MLQNAYFLAKIGADTAENEQHFAEMELEKEQAERRSAEAPVGDTTADRQNFGKMLLVFGCIATDFCKKIRVLQHFSKSTRLSSCNF